MPSVSLQIVVGGNFLRQIGLLSFCRVFSLSLGKLFGEISNGENMWNFYRFPIRNSSEISDILAKLYMVTGILLIFCPRIHIVPQHQQGVLSSLSYLLSVLLSSVYSHV